MGRTDYIRIPGTQTHELPPLLVHSVPDRAPLEDVVHLAEDMIEAEDLLGDAPSEAEREQRRMDLALNLVEQYRSFLAHWSWGDSVLGWTRQCEITFESRESLRQFLHPDLWPHASRNSFVTLLLQKRVEAPGVRLENAVGLRLTFRQPPPLDCFSDQFLLFLNSPVAGTAYRTWARMNTEPTGLLPPDRFTFQVLSMD